MRKVALFSLFCESKEVPEFGKLLTQYLQVSPLPHSHSTQGPPKTWLRQGDLVLDKAPLLHLDKSGPQGDKAELNKSVAPMRTRLLKLAPLLLRRFDNNSRFNSSSRFNSNPPRLK